MDQERLERIEQMLLRMSKFLDRWEPILEKFMSNPAAKFMVGRRK